MHLWSCSVLTSLKLNFIDHKNLKFTQLKVYPVMYEKILDLKEVEIAFIILINIIIIRLKQVFNAT